MMVVFPAPLGPKSPKISFSLMEKSTSLSAIIGPALLGNVLKTWETTSGCMGLYEGAGV